MSMSELKELTIYVNGLIDEHYGKKHCPKWVNYEMFKKEKCDKLVEILRDNNLFSFVEELHFSFESSYLDTGAGGINVDIEQLTNTFILPKRIEEIIGYEEEEDHVAIDEDEYDEDID